MGRARIEDHRLRLEDGRTIGYSGWGDPAGMPVLFGHGTPGSRRDRYYPGLDDQEWLLRRRVRFIGVDRPGYGYSDPWPEPDCSTAPGTSHGSPITSAWSTSGRSVPRVVGHTSSPLARWSPSE